MPLRRLVSSTAYQTRCQVGTAKLLKMGSPFLLSHMVDNVARESTYQPGELNIHAVSKPLYLQGLRCASNNGFVEFSSPSLCRSFLMSALETNRDNSAAEQAPRLLLKNVTATGFVISGSLRKSVNPLAIRVFDLVEAIGLSSFAIDPSSLDMNTCFGFCQVLACANLV